MLKKFLLLISFIAFTASAAEKEDVDWESSISGFAYYRAFSDKDWHEDDAKVAANFFLGYGPVSVSAQISKSMEPTEEVLKRAFLTGDVFVSNKAHFHLDAGRIPVFSSFYNNATDSPSAAGMALLPLAGYSHRMNNGMFTLLDGYRLRFDTIIGTSELMQFQYTQGEVFIENQNNMQREAFGQSPRTDIEISSKDAPSRAISVRYENDFLVWFFSRNEYNGHTDVVSLNPFSNAISSMYRNFNYTLEKHGLRYFNKHFFIQGEYVVGNTQVHSSTNMMTVDTTAYDRHGIIGFNLHSCTRVYFGHSVGHSGKTTVDDTFIGVTRDWGDWVLSVDYHQGQGHPWAKYDQDYTKPMEWKSVVSSLSYRFQ